MLYVLGHIAEYLFYFQKEEEVSAELWLDDSIRITKKNGSDSMEALVYLGKGNNLPWVHNIHNEHPSLGGTKKVRNVQAIEEVHSLFMDILDKE